MLGIAPESARALDYTTQMSRGTSGAMRSVVSGTVDLDTEEGRSFLQERLAFFFGVGFLFQAGFFVLGRIALAVVAPDVVFGAPSLGKLLLAFGDAGPQALYLGAWLYVRRGRRPPAVLRVLDAFMPVATCTIAVLPLARGGALAGAAFASLLIIVTVLMARAVIVPSSPRKTLRVGIASAVPLLVLTRDLEIPVPLLETRTLVPFLVPGLLWAVAAVALSTLTSTILFGLRRRVREAQQLGQYTLEDKLGEGGMGAVYRARHAMLRRPTAVKLLPPERAAGRDVQRFEREVQATALLSHPNTVAIYDYGRTPDGVFYYAMEYLEGIDLEALVAGFGPQPPGRVVHLLSQVAGALGEAHAAGLIHRDVKPGNVILCQRGGAPDVAKVVDFGLVRDLAGVGPGTESALDVVKGTPLYLSPEAITRPDGVDARSDLYALGALGYFLLTGRHPFEGATVVEVCSHHLHTAPEPPSSRLGGALPADLEAVVLECLEKAPERRPQTAAELAERLEACAVESPWSERDAREWWRRNGARVREMRRSVRRSEFSPLPTIAVSLEERLAGAGVAR
jgi:serine/threonine-protein kinase